MSRKAWIWAKQIAIVALSMACLIFARFGLSGREAPPFAQQTARLGLEFRDYYLPIGYRSRPEKKQSRSVLPVESPGGTWHVSFFDNVQPNKKTLVITTSPAGARISIYDCFFWRYAGLNPVTFSPPPVEYNIKAVLAGHRSVVRRAGSDSDDLFVTIHIELQRSEEQYATAANAATSPRAAGINYTYDEKAQELSITDNEQNSIASFHRVCEPPIVRGRSIAFLRRWDLEATVVTVPVFGYVEDAHIKLTAVDASNVESGDLALFPLGRFGLVKDGDDAAAFDLVESRELWRQVVPGEWIPNRIDDFLILRFSDMARVFDVFSGTEVWRE